MNKGFLLLFFVFGAIFSAFSQQSQHPICGNAQEQSELLPRLRENKVVVEALRAAAQDRGEIKYVPIFFHLVGDANGNGKHREIKVLEQLCALNAAYLPTGIQFYFSPHPTSGLFNKTINDDNVYNNQSNGVLMNLSRHGNALNVYVVQEPGFVNQPGSVAAYYSSAEDWIVIRKTETNGNQPNSTLSHVMGHFFSLLHTFYGWEDKPFDPSFPGWPIAPLISPGGSPTEYQNGTNCSIAADEICDTPPDYGFGFLASSCANYTGGAKDPLGELVDPMENNYMGSFSDCSNYAFTQNQADLMNADLLSSSRNYLDNTFSPVATEITTLTDLLVSPISGSTVPYYNNVLIEWQAVPGATHYLIETDLISTFTSPIAQTYIETGTSKILTGLSPSKAYYWRVKPFNYLVGCATPRIGNFKTSSISATVEIEGLSAWQLSPNPVTAELVNLKFNADQAFEAGIRITDAAGRTVSFQQNVAFPQGESNLELRTEGLSNGLYFVSLENGSGRNVLKMSVLR